MSVTLDNLKEISLPFPSFQPNTLILSEQVNDNNDEIQYRTNLLIKSYLKHVLEVMSFENTFDEHVGIYNTFVDETGNNFSDVRKVAQSNKEYLENLTRKLASDLNVVVGENKDYLETLTRSLVSDLTTTVNNNKKEANQKISTKGDSIEIKNTLLYLKSGDEFISVADLSGLGGGVGRASNIAYGQFVKTSDWVLDEETGFYSVNIEHRLTTDSPFVSYFDNETGFNIFDISKKVDANNILIYNEEPIDVYISVINGSSKIELVQAILDDENITPLRTWSSEKIKEYVDNSMPGGLASDIIMSDGNNVEDTLSSHKTSILSLDTEMQEVKQSVSNGKKLVANAITDKGIPTLATDNFQTMANNISLIQTGLPEEGEQLITVFTQIETPTANSMGDIWVCTDRAFDSIEFVTVKPDSNSPKSSLYLLGKYVDFSFNINKALENINIQKGEDLYVRYSDNPEIVERTIKTPIWENGYMKEYTNFYTAYYWDETLNDWIMMGLSYYWDGSNWIKFSSNTYSCFYVKSRTINRLSPEGVLNKTYELPSSSIPFKYLDVANSGNNLVTIDGGSSGVGTNVRIYNNDFGLIKSFKDNYLYPVLTMAVSTYSSEGTVCISSRDSQGYARLSYYIDSTTKHISLKAYYTSGTFVMCGGGSFNLSGVFTFGKYISTPGEAVIIYFSFNNSSIYKCHIKTSTVGRITTDNKKNLYASYNGGVSKISYTATGVPSPVWEYKDNAQFTVICADINDYVYVFNATTNELLKLDSNGSLIYKQSLDFRPNKMYVDDEGYLYLYVSNMVYKLSPRFDKVWETSTVGIDDFCINYQLKL